MRGKYLSVFHIGFGLCHIGRDVATHWHEEATPLYVRTHSHIVPPPINITSSQNLILLSNDFAPFTAKDTPTRL